MRDARKFVRACCPEASFTGASSSHTRPPGGSLVSSKPVSGDGSSATVSESGCPAFSSMFWSLRAYPSRVTESVYGPGGRSIDTGDLSPTLTLSTSTVASAGVMASSMRPGLTALLYQ